MQQPGVAQLVARLTGGQEAVSSSLATRTNVVADFVSFATAFSFSKQTPSLTHSVAPPLQIEPASLGFDLAFENGAFKSHKFTPAGQKNDVFRHVVFLSGVVPAARTDQDDWEGSPLPSQTQPMAKSQCCAKVGVYPRNRSSAVSFTSGSSARRCASRRARDSFGSWR